MPLHDRGLEPSRTHDHKSTALTARPCLFSQFHNWSLKLISRTKRLSLGSIETCFKPDRLKTSGTFRFHVHRWRGKARAEALIKAKRSSGLVWSRRLWNEAWKLSLNVNKAGVSLKPFKGLRRCHNLTMSRLFKTRLKATRHVLASYGTFSCGYWKQGSGARILNIRSSMHSYSVHEASITRGALA